MPFAEYKNFQDCVSKNKDKSNPQAYCGSIKAKTEGTAKHADVSDNSKTLLENEKEFNKESSEHPTLQKKTISQIVSDHQKLHSAKHLKRSIARCWKEVKAKYSKQQAEHSGLAQIPIDYKKNIISSHNVLSKKKTLAKHWKAVKAKHSQLLSHGLIPPKRARHSNEGIHMPEYALVDCQFLREGDFHTNGVAYHYPWEVIERDAQTFKGEDFFINHTDTNGTEMGIIEDVYTEMIDGTNWLCAKVKVPEVPFTQDFLQRIETGLIHDVSSTHDFITDPNDPTKTVKKIVGKALSTVSEGEVEGAKIRSIKRHLKE